ncbi:MAG: response regulator [Gammaproteobacteria bacterium]|nr:response regulator [Gammaproteobacteria bacterium]
MDIDRENTTLLVVDDTPTNLKILLTYLHKLKFKVQVAIDGEEALQQVAYAHPDLILLDVMMPKLDGFETCSRLKADETTRDIPIIFMTALSETLDKVKGLELGAVDYITKPFQHEEVLARINTHLTLKKQKKIIEQKNLELQQQNAELDAFAHTVAHDLKNPVNLIVNANRFLLRSLAQRVNPEELEFLQYAAQAGHKMANIINALLLLASARTQEVNMTALDMPAIIAQVQDSLAYMIREYQAEIKMPPTWPAATGYAPWIEEVWRNYISNALKYGGNPPRLELGAASEKNAQVRFWVRDNGPGLSKEDISCLFVPFSRISQVRVEGHGLGLSIVQRIVEKSGGRLGVDSQKGQGSTFYFTLPTLC